MKKEKYQKIVLKNAPDEERGNHLVASFITGGIMGLLANLLIEVYSYCFHLSMQVSGILMLITFIFLACLLTSLGVFDDLVSRGKMGFIIPITGFAHSIQSAILDYKKEGPIYGFGSNVFKLAGSVILYGVVAAFILGFIRYVFCGG